MKALRAVSGITAGSALTRVRHSTRDTPLFALHGDQQVDLTWPECTGARDSRIPGEMGSLGDYARSGFDPDHVRPDVRALCEQTATFEMTVIATQKRTA